MTRTFPVCVLFAPGLVTGSRRDGRPRVLRREARHSERNARTRATSTGARTFADLGPLQLRGHTQQ